MMVSDATSIGPFVTKDSVVPQGQPGTAMMRGKKHLEPSNMFQYSRCTKTCDMVKVFFYSERFTRMPRRDLVI